jgi:hypothetical protein
VDNLAHLDGVSCDKLVMKVPGASGVDAPLLPVPQRAARLVAWAEGSDGPGLDALADALTELRTVTGPTVPTLIRRLVGGSGKVLRKHPRAFAAGGGGAVVLGATIWLAWGWMYPGVDFDTFYSDLRRAQMTGNAAVRLNVDRCLNKQIYGEGDINPGTVMPSTFGYVKRFQVGPKGEASTTERSRMISIYPAENIDAETLRKSKRVRFKGYIRSITNDNGVKIKDASVQIID